MVASEVATMLATSTGNPNSSIPRLNSAMSTSVLMPPTRPKRSNWYQSFLDFIYHPNTIKTLAALLAYHLLWPRRIQ